MTTLRSKLETLGIVVALGLLGLVVGPPIATRGEFVDAAPSWAMPAAADAAADLDRCPLAIGGNRGREVD